MDTLTFFTPRWIIAVHADKDDDDPRSYFVILSESSAVPRKARGTQIKIVLDNVSMMAGEIEGLADQDFANRDYQELNQVDRDRAYREIQELVGLGLLRQAGEKAGTRYRVVMERSDRITSLDPLERLRSRMDANGYIKNEDYRAAFRIDRRAATRALLTWESEDVLVREGERRGTRYRPGPNWPPGS